MQISVLAESRCVIMSKMNLNAWPLAEALFVFYSQNRNIKTLFFDQK